MKTFTTLHARRAGWHFIPGVAALLALLLAAGAPVLRAASDAKLPSVGEPDAKGVYQTACVLDSTPKGGPAVYFTAGVNVNEGNLHFAIDTPWDSGSMVARGTLQSFAKLAGGNQSASPPSDIAGRATGLLVDDELGHITGLCPIVPLAKNLCGISPNTPGALFSAKAILRLEFKVEGASYALVIEVRYSPSARPSVLIYDPQDPPEIAPAPGP